MEIELIPQDVHDQQSSDQKEASTLVSQEEDERINEAVSITIVEESNSVSKKSKETADATVMTNPPKQIREPLGNPKYPSPKSTNTQTGHVNLAFAQEESSPGPQKNHARDAMSCQITGKGEVPIAVNVPKKENDGTKEKQAVSEEKKELAEKEAVEEHHERGGWGNQLDFLFSCISVSVGLGNIWRFPYLCFRNGGGSFLFTYFIAMIFCGIPVFFQEVAIGQYLGVGGMTLIAQLAPIMKGVGYATMTVVFLINVYYCVIIAWTMFYLIASFTALPGLPWDTCEGWWNTANCFIPTENTTGLSNSSVSAVEEFWSLRVLGATEGIDNIGGMRWELFGTLILSYVLVYFIMCF